MSEGLTTERTAKTQKEAPSQMQSFIQNDQSMISEVVEKVMALDEFYPKGHLEKQIPDSSISRRNQKFFGCFGINSYKRFNLHYLEDNVIIYATGNTYQIYNMDSNEKKVFIGQDTDGIGSIAVHPSRNYFAVAEKGKMPNIFIYEYPSLKLYRILRNGTENLFSHIEFSSSGTKLASVGGNPDYTITVWDWIIEKVVLKAKAFSQEVYKVTFSPYTDDILFTCGSGHIRFWKMAQTFTGLKLQGEIGKFGQLELSDVTGVAELPDGKVLCGSEYGTLILWDGNLVKAHIVRDVHTKEALHKGFIEVVMFDGENFITAGGDGYIRWWKFADVDNAEAGDHLEVAIHPVKEQLVLDETNNTPAYIVTMVKGPDHWLIGDGHGKIWKVHFETMRVEQVLSFHSKRIQDIAIPQAINASITIGEDGTVRMWDFVKDKQFYTKGFIGAGTCVDLMAYADANQGRILAVGFDNGIVRVLLIGSHDFMILKSFKAHDSKIVKVKYAPDNTMFVAASENGELFFFEIGLDNVQRYEPLCLVQIPSPTPTKITDLRWDSNSSRVLVSCSNGRVYQYERPNPKDIDNHETYLVENLNYREWRIKMMEFQMKKNQKKDPEEEEKKKRMRLRGELPKEEDEPEEDWDPEPILAALYLNDGSGRFLITSQGLFAGFYYICDFNSLRPLQAIPITKEALCYIIDYSPSGHFMVMGFENGEVQIRHVDNPNRYLSIKMHDGHNGKITAMRFDKEEKYVMTSGEDGLMYIHQIDKECMRKEAIFNALAGIEGAEFMAESQREDITFEKTKQFMLDNQPYFPEIDPESDCINQAYLASSLRLTEEVNVDILDPTQYSIQQAKLRTEEDHRMKLADEKKLGVRGKIELLRETFKRLNSKNNTAEDWVRLTGNDFIIDPEYFQMLRERNMFKIEEAKKEVAWGIEFHTVRLNKLKEKFYDVLEFEKFTVKALKTTNYVTTFRVHKMSEFLQKSIETFKQMLENEMLMGGAQAGNEFEDQEGAEGNADGSGSPSKKDKDAKDAASKTQTNTLNAKATGKQLPQASQTQQHKTEGERKREERKLEREMRKKKIEKLEKKEAMHSGEDPEDRKEIQLAKQTYGDFKLKLAANYVVPENQRVNFAKKRQQMVLLEGSIHKLKVDFNKKIAELKGRKKEIIDRVKQLNTRLRQINSDLGDSGDLFEPSIDETVEYPEKFFEVQDADIENYRKVKAEREKAAAAAQRKGGFGSKKAAAAAPTQTEEEKALAEKEAAGKAAEEQKAKTNINEDKKRLQGVDRKGKKIQESDLDEEMRQIKRIELSYEKEQLTSEINSLIDSFDTDIKDMQKEKYRLESDLKNAEMKLILYFEELILLKSMEGRDHELTKRLAKCRQDKGVILREINGISAKLRDKKVDIDKIKVREDDLMAKFHELCPEGSDKYDIIRAYFEKVQKIRKGKRGGGNQNAEKDPNAEDDEDEEPEEEEPEEEEDEDEENAIVGLPQEEYKIDEIDKLREERTKMYNEKQDILAFINDLEVQRKRLEKQEERISQELEETEEEIHDFQKEKMTKLNQLDVSVVLKIKQIQNLIQLNPANPGEAQQLDKWEKIKAEDAERRAAQGNQEGMDDQDGAHPQHEAGQSDEIDWRGCYLPETLKDSVLFTRSQLLGLINRKRELDEERVNLDKAFNEYKRDHNQKKKEIKENEKVRAEREKEYNERQMLRFGNLVDLDNLEVSGPSALVLDLQNKFHKTEKKCIHMIEEADSELEKTQRDLTQAIKNNTNLLNLIRQLGEEQLDLNRKLDSTNKAIFVDEDDEVKKNMMEEKEKLKKLLELQAKEIETLKTEINLYKKKGGHIYTKVTTNRRVANLNQD